MFFARLLLLFLPIIPVSVPASDLPGETTLNNIMEFVPVPAGCFQMGNTFGDGYHIERPVHKVCVSEFSIGKFDVTKGAFNSFVTDTGYRTEAEKAGFALEAEYFFLPYHDFFVFIKR